MKIAPARLSAIVAGTIAIAIAAAVYVQPAVGGDSIFEQVRKFNDVLGLTVKGYVDDVDTQKLTEAAIRGMLSELDPHSVYIPAKEMERVEEEFSGSFEGIGVEFDVIADTITIVSPIVGGPSEALGIMAGDKIVKINDTTAIGMSRTEVPKKLRGKKGTQVKVHIRRTGEKSLLVFDITRDKIPLNSVDASFMIDQTDIGYITANRFSATTHDEIIEAARKLKAQGMKRLLLDLRSNPGGYLDQAFQIADEFIGAGKKIVYTRGRRPEFDEDFMATQHGELENIPLVVLINGGSASASEIVSGAVQDLDRGIVVGETSFGKGLVQRQYPLGDGSAVRITIAKYYTPSGRLIQRPYANKKEYYSGVGRDEGEEGDNIEHQSDIAHADSSKAKPQYKTAGGRTVYGGGGITPDYIVKADTIGMLARKLRSKNLFWKTADQIMKQRGKIIRDDYQGKMTAFLNTFEVTPTDIDILKSFADQDSITWDAKDYTFDEEFIKMIIKAHIGRNIFNNNGYTSVMLRMDSQAKKAMELFDEAKKIAQIN
ncbi:MAG: S41 family peptidase [Chlorobi bacterium]|nr:MAG: S41 family peptidase [Bacteroidota bacterium]KXK32503.1 MAG: periplasmic protease [Chlorobi bacterium OLB6]MBL1161620.1 S41 family peptidase [Chlorobiota bacterium]MBW7852754.1 S41 family peptidase [Candidatus Kapabacteria bacterium]MCC6332335.1 S41 family peptidase [Ignavibacteria bacterium]